MTRWFLLVPLVFILILSGCMQDSAVQKAESKVVATVNNEQITQNDLEFYEWLNKIQIEMYREEDKKKRTGKDLEEAMKYWDQRLTEAKDRNTLLTQAIRLRSAALLAKEKGVTPQPGDIEKDLGAVKTIYAASPIATRLINEYGVGRFWAKQREQFERIVLVRQVQLYVKDKVRQANLQAEAKEVNMLAEKKYEELLVSQIDTLDIKINK